MRNAESFEFSELPLEDQQKFIDEAEKLSEAAWREVFQLQQSIATAIRNNPDEPEGVVVSSLIAFADSNYALEQIFWMWALMIYRSAKVGLGGEPA